MDPVFRLTIPGKVQSYLQAGIPIVGMLDGEDAMVVEESGAGMVCAAGDSDGLAEAVARLALMEPESRQRMGEQGVVYTRREFDRDTLILRLEALLVSMQSGKRKTEKAAPQAGTEQRIDAGRRYRDG